VEPPTTRAAHIVKFLKGIFVAQIVLAVIQFFLFQEIMSILYSVLAIMVLYAGYSRCEYCRMVFYVWFNASGLVSSFIMCGKLIQ